MPLAAAGVAYALLGGEDVTSIFGPGGYPAGATSAVAGSTILQPRDLIRMKELEEFIGKTPG